MEVRDTVMSLQRRTGDLDPLGFSAATSNFVINFLIIDLLFEEIFG